MVAGWAKTGVLLQSQREDDRNFKRVCDCPIVSDKGCYANPWAGILPSREVGREPEFQAGCELRGSVRRASGLVHTGFPENDCLCGGQISIVFENDRIMRLNTQVLRRPGTHLPYAEPQCDSIHGRRGLDRAMYPWESIVHQKTRVS